MRCRRIRARDRASAYGAHHRGFGRQHPPERLVRAIQWSQFWTRHGGDEVLVEHDTVRLAPLRGDTSVTPEQASAAEDAYIARIRALQEAFTRTATIETIGIWSRSLRGWLQPGR
jgi:hypothetical protein